MYAIIAHEKNEIPTNTTTFDFNNKIINMKKILLATNVLTALALCAMLFTGCTNKPDSNPDDGGHVIENITPTNNSCGTCEGTVSRSTMSAAYFRSLLGNYRNHNWQATSALLNNRRDSRSVWFDLNTLKSFIAAIESNVANACEGDHCSKQLGLRIYFGQYGGIANAPISQYDSLHTLVMVPTMRMETKKSVFENVDFDYQHLQGCNPLALHDTMAEFTALMPYIPVGVMNHGTLIPPPDLICTGAKFMHFVDKLDNVTTGVANPCY